MHLTVGDDTAPDYAPDATSTNGLSASDRHALVSSNHRVNADLGR